MTVTVYRYKRFDPGRRKPRKTPVVWNPEFEEAFFGAPSPIHALMWAWEMGYITKRKGTVRIHLYEVEVPKKEQVIKRNWGGFKDIVILPPYRVVRHETCREMSWRDLKKAITSLERSLRTARVIS